MSSPPVETTHLKCAPVQYLDESCEVKDCKQFLLRALGTSQSDSLVPLRSMCIPSSGNRKGFRKFWQMPHPGRFSSYYSP